MLEACFGLVTICCNDIFGNFASFVYCRLNLPSVKEGANCQNIFQARHDIKLDPHQIFADTNPIPTRRVRLCPSYTDFLTKFWKPQVRLSYVVIHFDTMYSLGNYQIKFSVSVSLCNHHWNLQKRLSNVCQFTQGHYAIRHVDKHLRVDNTAFNGQSKAFLRLDWVEKSSFSETLLIGLQYFFVLFICN